MGSTTAGGVPTQGTHQGTPYLSNGHLLINVARTVN